VHRRILARPEFSIAVLVVTVFAVGCSPETSPSVKATAADPPAAAEETTEAMEDPVQETIVLLHGMGRSRASFLIMQQRLKNAGYVTLNFPYSTPGKSVDELSDKLKAYVTKNVKTEKYHFVAHSLGNIIIRNGFREGAYRAGLGRMVMLGPPNQPADLAVLFKDFKPYQWIMGESGQELSSAEFYADLPVPPIEFGVIAGDKGQRLSFDEPNDGVVTVASTKLGGMKDWVLLHHTHTFMMNSKDTASQCLHFLKHGEFVEIDK
jgi:triacylglycerol lipase